MTYQDTRLDTIINVGTETITIKTHPNAPVVLNFYTFSGKSKRYNKNSFYMKYSSLEGKEWMLETMQKFSKVNTVWYIAGIEERYSSNDSM